MINLFQNSGKLVILILNIRACSIFQDHLAYAITFAVLKLALIASATGPLIHALAVRQAIFVLSFVNMTVGEIQFSVSFGFTVDILAFIIIASI